MVYTDMGVALSYAAASDSKATSVKATAFLGYMLACYS